MCLYLFQVIEVLDFACSEPEDCQFELFFRHSTSIIGYQDVFEATICNIHDNTCASRIDGVFNQFLDHRHGPLYYFTSCNLFAGFSVKYGYCGHSTYFLAAPKLILFLPACFDW